MKTNITPDLTGDEKDPRFLFSLTHSDTVMAVALGIVDARVVARRELAARGLGVRGTWVGFDRARAEWGVK